MHCSTQVTVPAIDYADNARCLSLLEAQPHGIFQLLDTCCRVNATPANFCLQVLIVNYNSNTFYTR